jgi:thymidine kinase
MDRRVGRVEVICGPMFAGKTEELLRRVRRAVVAGRAVQVFTHSLDTRHSAGQVTSHVGLGHPAVAVSGADAIERAIGDDTEMVAIDEAQFFGVGLVDPVMRLAERGLVVVVGGLDITFEGLPFEPLPSLMVLAERVEKLTAVCTVCGEDAVFHTRVVETSTDATDLVGEHVGGLDKYQARCRRHFTAVPATN